MDDIILVGYGGHAKSIADSIEQSGKYRIIGYTEKNACNVENRYPYLGSDDVLQEYFLKGVRYAFVCIGYMGNGTIRDRLYQQLKTTGYELPVIIDPSAVVAENAHIKEGTYIGKGAVVNSESTIGEMCIINTKAVIEHECKVAAFSHIAVAGVLCGNVTVGAHSLIGANATIIQGVEIGSDCVIGAGSIVLKDVQPGKCVYGVVSEKAKI